TDELHTWKCSDLAAGNTEKKETRALKGRDPEPKVFTAGNGGSVSNYNYNSGNNVIEYKGKDVVDDLVVVNLSYSDEESPVLKEISKDDWDEMVKYGCTWCGTDVLPEDKGLLIYPDEGVILCPSCSGEEETTISTCSLGVNSNLV